MATAFVQGTGVASVGSVANVSKAFTSNVTAGNCIAVATCCNNTVPGTSDVTDDLTNSYTRDVVVNGIAAGRAASAGYHAFNIAGGACTVTFDPTGSDFMTIGIAELSGTGSSDPIDGTGTANAGFGTSVTTSTWTMAGNGTIFGGLEHNGADTTLDPGAGFTLIFESENTVNAMPLIAIYQDGISAGSGKSASFTLGAGRSGTAFGMGLKEGAGGGGGGTFGAHLFTTRGMVF